MGRAEEAKLGRTVERWLERAEHYDPGPPPDEAWELLADLREARLLLNRFVELADENDWDVPVNVHGDACRLANGDDPPPGWVTDEWAQIVKERVWE